MEVKPGYKQTEVGVIPEEWEAGGLGRFWSVTDCKHVTAEFVANGIPLASIKEVQNRFVDLTNAKQTTNHFYSLLIEGGRKPCSGDLILSRNATVGEVAQVAEWHPQFAMGQDVCLLRKKSPGHSTEFLQAVFQSPVIANQLSDLMVGSTFKRVNVEQIRNFSVPMPHPPEQRAIATALSDVDGLLGGLDRLIAKKRDLKQAAMQQLLTGQTRLPGFAPASQKSKQTEVGLIPEDWNHDYIENFARIATGSKNTQDRIQDGDYPFFVRSQIVERINSYSVDGEAVLTAGDGVGTGKVFHYINGKFDVHQRVYRISNFAENVNGYFFYLYFSNHFYGRVKQMTAKSSVDSVRRNMIARMLIPLPRTKAEQIAIAEVLTDMDAELAGLEQRREKTRALKQAMMQELLTGRTRLVSKDMKVLRNSLLQGISGNL